MKNSLLALVLFSSTLSFASSTEAFIQGLRQDLHFTETKRAVELSDSIHVKPFNSIDGWMSPDAIATYNGNLNTIKLAQENLLSRGPGTYQIKDAREIRGKQYNSSKLSTIFHEMGHAELDVLIENKIELEDTGIMSHYNHVLKPFYKKSFSGNSHTIFHEHFAYYRTEIIDFMYGEQENILLNNGFNKYKSSCFLTPMLRKQLQEGIALEDFQKFQTFGDAEAFYRLKVDPKFIFVKGKDIDLYRGQGAKEVLARTNLLFWGYHQRFYNFPMNQKDYVKRMNQSSGFKAALASCREKLWLERAR